jgi:hypothetical protein
MTQPRRSISTGIERIFRRRPDGLYQEVTNHFIHMTDGEGNKVSKLDRSYLGAVFREAQHGERSFNGEAEWTNPDTGQTIRLVAFSNNQQGIIR